MMRTHVLRCLLCGMLSLAFALAASQANVKNLDDNLKILETSKDPKALQAAGENVASSGDARAVLRLGELLRRNEFLARLDNIKSSDAASLHLRPIMAALAAHAIPAVGAICLALSKDENFTKDEDRMDSLLETLAAVKPLSPEAVDLFRRTNAQGYFAFNAPLLVQNGSPRALELFESMIEDGFVSVNRRVDSIHRSILPYRTSLPVLNSVERLLASKVEEPVAVGLIETIFDYQPKRWFGPAVGTPRPPAWEGASAEALQVVIRLGENAMMRPGLPNSLMTATDMTLTSVRTALQDRKR